MWRTTTMTNDWLSQQENSLAKGEEYAFLQPLENLGNFQRDVLLMLANLRDRIEELILKVQILGERSPEPRDRA
jgi:hypothetical protein